MTQQMKLFHAITDIRDETIEAALDTKLQKSHAHSWIAAAACLLLVVGIGGIAAMNKWLPFGGNTGGAGAGGSGHADGATTFMSYAGPVFPLTLREGDPTITATRNIAYDFALANEDDLRVWGSHVTDSYTIHNSSAEDKTLRLIYPFAGSFKELAKQMPAVTVEGKAVSPTLFPGGYSGGFTSVYGADDPDGSANILQLNSWEDYKTLLGSGSYMADAFADDPILSRQVTVYAFTDFEAPLAEYDAATQAVSFTMDPEKTQILLYGFNGGEYGDHGERRFSYFVPNATRPESDEKYLIVIGDDIGAYSLQGYKNGACEKGNELDGVSATVTRTQAALSDVLRDVVGNFLSVYDNGEGFAVSEELFLGAVSAFLQEYGITSQSVRDRYESGMLEDIISETRNLGRVFYLEFPVTVPAGESVSIEATLHKEPSFDFACTGTDNVGVQGYDMVTRLGSNLQFTELSASLEHTDRIEIVGQNYGFDLENGLQRVALDASSEHYYLEIRTLAKDE